MRRIHGLALLLLGIAVVLLVAACGGTAVPPAAPQTSASTSAASASAASAAPAKAAASGAARDVCGLIPGADLAAVVGKPIVRQQAQSPGRCIYYTDDPMLFVDISVDRDNGADSWKGVNGGNSLIGASQDAVAGLGDQAFFGPRDRLYVLKGNTFLAVEAGFDDKVRDRAKKVAELALTRAA
jgi:hypothetical protein